MQLLSNTTLRAAAPSLRPQPMIYLHVPRQYKHIDFVLLNDLVDLGLLLLLLACAYNNNRHKVCSSNAICRSQRWKASNNRYCKILRVAVDCHSLPGPLFAKLTLVNNGQAAEGHSKHVRNVFEVWVVADNDRELAIGELAVLEADQQVPQAVILGTGHTARQQSDIGAGWFECK